MASKRRRDEAFQKRYVALSEMKVVLLPFSSEVPSEFCPFLPSFKEKGWLEENTGKRQEDAKEGVDAERGGEQEGMGLQRNWLKWIEE